MASTAAADARTLFQHPFLLGGEGGGSLSLENPFAMHIQHPPVEQPSSALVPVPIPDQV